MRPKNAPRHLFDKVEHESIAEAAVAQIEDMILSGVLNEGDMLPGERELAEQLGMSRPKVREALRILADNDLLRIVANDGVYVAQLGGQVMSPAMVALFNRNASAIRDNLEYRRESEAFAARLAAERATVNDRREMERLIEEMAEADKEDDEQKGADLDLRLHTTISFASYNRTLTHMMGALYNLNRTTIFYNRSEMLRVDRSADRLYQQHCDLVEEICSGHPEKAATAARAHIDYVALLMESAIKRRSREALAEKRYAGIIGH